MTQHNAALKRALASISFCLVAITISAFTTKPLPTVIALDKVRVVDGDTLEIDGRKVRLWGIDAPELRQKCGYQNDVVDCGLEAKTVLSKLIEADELACRKISTDRYLRSVEQCWVGSFDAAELMVEMGYALNESRYSHGNYLVAEEKAKNLNHGIWRYVFDRPSEWRKGNRINLDRPLWRKPNPKKPPKAVVKHYRDYTKH